MNATCTVVCTGVGHYGLACFRALAELLPGLQVVEVAGTEHKYPWRPNKKDPGFALRTLFPDTAFEEIPVRRQWVAVEAALKEIGPEVVVVGSYSVPVVRAAVRWAWKREIPTILRLDSTYCDRRRWFLIEALKRRLVRRHTVVAVAGELAQDYALQLGVRQKCIRRLGNVVDNEYFASSAEAVRRNEARERERLGLPTCYFLTVSRLSPEKNLRTAIVAFAEYRHSGGSWDMVLVGSGPQEVELKQMVRAKGISGVHFAVDDRHQMMSQMS